MSYRVPHYLCDECGLEAMGGSASRRCDECGHEPMELLAVFSERQMTLYDGQIRRTYYEGYEAGRNAGRAEALAEAAAASGEAPKPAAPKRRRRR